MIKIKLHKAQGITNISVSGHAGYDEYGKDIVCAAVSATVLTTINGIMAIDDTIIEVIENEDEMVIKVKKHDKISQILLDNMLSCLQELVNEYPKNIKIHD